MMLSITTTHRPASDLGFLLHKHPDKLQSFDLSFGAAHAYYPEVADDRCTACLLLDVDAVGLVRGKSAEQNFQLAQYVNDRPYVASSFLSVAIAQVFGSALQGRCNARPELVATPIPLEARLDALPVRGGEAFLRSIFEPLGYVVEAVRRPLDEKFPEWGDSPYFSVAVRQTLPLSQLLAHLYVLVPVFDARKHYYIGDDELEKLLAKGEGWLADHPAKDEIARRYLGNRRTLYREALSRLEPEESPDADDENGEKAEEVLESGPQPGFVLVVRARPWHRLERQTIGFRVGVHQFRSPGVPNHRVRRGRPISPTSLPTATARRRSSSGCDGNRSTVRHPRPGAGR